MAGTWLESYLDRMEEMSGRFFRYFHQRLSEASSLSPSQFFLLKTVAESRGVTVTDMAGRLGMSPAGATGLIDRMEKLGLVERTRDEQDRRLVWVALLPAGREQLAQSRQVRREVMGDLLGRLSRDEVAELVHLYEKMTGAIPEMGSERE